MDTDASSRASARFPAWQNNCVTCVNGHLADLGPAGGVTGGEILGGVAWASRRALRKLRSSRSGEPRVEKVRGQTCVAVTRYPIESRSGGGARVVGHDPRADSAVRGATGVGAAWLTIAIEHNDYGPLRDEIRRCAEKAGVCCCGGGSGGNGTMESPIRHDSRRERSFSLKSSGPFTKHDGLVFDKRQDRSFAHVWLQGEARLNLQVF